MNCELDSEDIGALTTTISEQAKRERRLAITIERREGDTYHLSMHTAPTKEPEITS